MDGKCVRVLATSFLLLLIISQAGHSCAQNPTLELIWETYLESLYGRGDIRNLEAHRSWVEKTVGFDRWMKGQSMKVYRENANDHGNIHNIFGMFEQALFYYEKSLEASKKMDDRWSEAIVLSNIGTVHHAKGQYDKASDLYKTALAAGMQFEDLKLEGIVSGNLGALYHQQGLYSKATEFYQRSLDISKDRMGVENKDMAIKGRGTVLGNMAILYRDWGQYSRALECYTKALQFKIRTGDLSGQGTILADMAKVYQDWGQNIKAKEYYEKALEKKIAGKDKRGEGDTLIRLGEFYQATGQNDDAVRFLQEGMEIWKKLGISIQGPESLLASIYLEQDQPEKAEAIVKRVSDECIRARLSLNKSDYSEAVNHFQKMLHTAEKNRNVDNLFVSYTGLGIAHEAIGKYSETEKYYNDAVQFTEELRSSLERDQRERFFDVKVNGFYRTAPYKGLARVLAKMNKGSDAFKASEFTKARVFSEAVCKRSAEQNLDVPPDILKSDEDINNQLSALKVTRQRAYEKEDKVLATSLEPQIGNLEKGLSSHVEMLRKKYPVFAATRYPQPMDLSQQALKENEWVVTYDVSDSGILIFLLKGKELVRSDFKPIGRDALIELVRKFRQPLDMESGVTLKEKLASFDFDAGKRLTDLLLGDLLRDLPKGVPVIIVPDDCLGLIPFEAIVLKDGGTVVFEGPKVLVSDSEFFGDRNQVSYCQSVTALTLARAASTNRKMGDQMLVIADPVFELKDERAQSATQTKVAEADKEHFENLMATIEDSTKGSFRFKRLPETTALADNLAKLYGDKVEKQTGLAASKSNFLGNKAQDIGKYRWLVFATHGLFSKQIPGLTEPFLALTMVPPGTDGFLTMSDVMTLKMSADLVALTACQTGLGKELSGEGVMSMGRAFQYAGAKSVLMSLWSVSEKSSVMLVENFFRNLKGGKTKLEALKLARDEIRKAGYDHPFFWAPFILVGELN